ncbi:MAG: FG-GAP repeat domain-containing protein, partial [Bacteroidales bacterium]
MRSKYTILIGLLFFLFPCLYAQTPSVNSDDNNSAALLFPWLGGLNSCQFGEIDLDMDGVRDFIVFDRMGNRLIPFLRKKTRGKLNYTYAPEYITRFPYIDAWIMFRDYNNDGKMDFFTCDRDNASMRCYTNVSDPDLKFRMEGEYITTLSGSGEVNLFLTYVDYPGITDLDGDGDMDVLTFWGLGQYVDLHQNMSVERYGNANHLEFEKVKTCWGNFEENEESNELKFGVCKNNDVWNKHRTNKIRHTGSTFLVRDFNGDG